MKKPSSVGFDDVESVFDRSLDVIHSTLISYYRLSEDEARGAEEDLRAWFQRLARRGSSTPSLKLLQASLLSAACQYGRSFQFWKLEGEPSVDVGLKEVLDRQPDEVAVEIQRRFDKERQ